MKKWLITICLAAILLVGCVRGTDPVTGEETVRVDPNAVKTIESGTQAAVGIMTVLSPFFPVLVPIVGIVGGILGTWYKVKPKLTKAQAEAEMYHSTAWAVVTAIDDFKKNYPKDWGKLEEKLEKLIGPKAENVIRALRGLPPKE